MCGYRRVARIEEREQAAARELAQFEQVLSEARSQLDVLRNYTPYSMAFKLATGGKELTEEEVERAAAMKRLMRWVRLHPYNIAQKVQVVVEHYRAVVQPLLDGG